MLKQIKERIEKINRVNIILFVLFILLLKVVFTYLFVLVASQLVSYDISAGTYKYSNPAEEILTVVIFGPALESFVLQYLPFQYLSNRIRPFGVILLSATLFGVVHNFNEMYQLYTFIAGLLYALIYHIKGENFKAFLTITVIHMLFNSIVVLENNF